MIRARKHRLDREQYQGFKLVDLTSVVENRHPVFLDTNVAKEHISILSDVLTSQRCIGLVYVLMPDHLHLVMRGDHEDSNSLSAFDKFKQKSAFALRRSGLPSWQPGYYDHLIRNSEDWKSHVRYLLQNPVRAGLVKEWHEWPYSGSIGMSLEEILTEL